MPATARRTRQQIRRDIGLATNKIWQDAGDVFSAPSETSPTAAKILDNALAYGAENEHRGKWILATDSNSSAETRKVIASSPDERSFTVSVPFSRAPDTGWTYELWEEDFSPTNVHNYINQALTEVTRKASITVEADSFHIGGSINAFAVDSSWTGIRKVEWRESYSGITLAAMDAAMSSLTANTAVALDSADRREGIGSVRLTVGAGESSATAIAASSFAAEDIRGYDQLEFWFKTSGTVTASAYVLQLMQGSSAQVEVSIPASSGDKWTYHTASIGATESNSSITAVQVSTGSSDNGSGVLWLDDVKTTRSKSGDFQTVPREFWSISQQNREVRLDKFSAPYAMLRITGVRPPALLTSDSAICEVDPNYIINYVHGMYLMGTANQNAGRRDAAGLNANTFIQYAQALRNRMNTPSNIRWLDD